MVAATVSVSDSLGTIQAAAQLVQDVPVTLVVEDGTGKSDAESYCSADFVSKYLADRGTGADWEPLLVARKEQLLRTATDYIELRFATRFRGAKTTEAQALSFPRNGEGTVPQSVMRACAEYAVRAAKAPLVADPVTDDSGHMLKSSTEKLGPLEEKTEYATTYRELFKPYPAADNLLKSLLRSSGIIR